MLNTLVCMSLDTARHVRHFRNADVRDLYPAIKLDAGLSADTTVKVPRRYCTFPSITNGTPVSYKIYIYIYPFIDGVYMTYTFQLINASHKWF